MEITSNPTLQLSSLHCELGSGERGGDVEGAGKVSPSGGLYDRIYVISMSQQGDMVVVIGGRGIGSGGYVAYEGIHSEAVGYQCRVYCKLPNL